MVIGRTQEQAAFKKWMQSTQAEFAVIYGRRRVGKTHLVQEYFEEHIVFGFTGSYETDTAIQLYNFYVELKRTWAAAETAKAPQNWSEIYQRQCKQPHQCLAKSVKRVNLPVLDRLCL